MIGLGKKYLTAAGFGRYRITAASLGNLDLLGTLSWLKAATKQAILGAFGDDGWAVIKATNAYLNGIAASDRDKATALAGWLNTYAIEDAHIVYSLVPTLGVTRWIKSNGTSTYIKTGLYPSTNMEVEGDIIYRNNTQSDLYLLSAFEQGNYGAALLGQYQMKYILTFGEYKNAGSIVVGQAVHIKAGWADISGYIYIDGTQILNATYTYHRVNNLEMYLFAQNYRGTAVQQYTQADIATLKIKQGGQLVREMYPFIRNGVNGMIDVLDGTFYANAGSGSFTISETPSTP